MAKRTAATDERATPFHSHDTVILAAATIAAGVLPALGISASADQLRIVAQVSLQLAEMIVEEAGR